MSLSFLSSCIATYKEQGIIFEDNLRQTFHQLQTHTMVHFRKDDCLNRMLTKYHHILSNEERIVEAAKVFRIFKTYWNFVDYSLLKHSIKEFGTNKLRSEMKKYIADLQRFMKGTTIQDYDDFSPPHFPEHFIVVTITQNKDPAEWTLYEVCQFKKELVKQSNEHAILTKIKKSRSVEIVFAFPPHALTKIYGVFNADFQEKHNIIEVTFNWRLQEIDYTCKSQCAPTYIILLTYLSNHSMIVYGQNAHFFTSIILCVDVYCMYSRYSSHPIQCYERSKGSMGCE